MRVIEEKAKHWALGKEFTCVKCQTRQVIESLEDFTLDRMYDWMVYSDCIRCGQSNGVEKGGNPYAEINKAWEDTDMSVPLKKPKRWKLL